MATEIREYNLMYYTGVWMTACKLYAESDAEAIFDADDYMKSEATAKEHVVYALFDGNRKVKTYDFVTKPFVTIIEQ